MSQADTASTIVPLRPSVDFDPAFQAATMHPAASAILADARRASVDPNADFDAAVLAYRMASWLYAQAEISEHLLALAMALSTIIVKITDTADEAGQALACAEQAPAIVWELSSGGPEGAEDVRSDTLDRLRLTRDRLLRDAAVAA